MNEDDFKRLMREALDEHYAWMMKQPRDMVYRCSDAGCPKPATWILGKQAYCTEHYDDRRKRDRLRDGKCDS